VDALFSPGAAGEGGRASRRDADGLDRRFPRTCRLTSRRQYVAVYEKGRRMASTSLVLFGLPNSRGECRLGITVTRKVGGAVQRNRIKRIMREVFRRHRESLAPSLDLVVNARPGFAEKTTAEIEQEFLRTFARLARRYR
jgi:ribonuclease P protein component